MGAAAKSAAAVTLRLRTAAAYPHQMRLAALLVCLALVACSPTELGQAPDATPCASACGTGTVCELGRCVPVDAGTAADSGVDVPLDHGGDDVPGPMDVVDVAQAADVGPAEVGVDDTGARDAGPTDAGIVDVGVPDTGVDVPEAADARINCAEPGRPNRLCATQADCDRCGRFSTGWYCCYPVVGGEAPGECRATSESNPYCREPPR